MVDENLSGVGKNWLMASIFIDGVLSRLIQADGGSEGCPLNIQASSSILLRGEVNMYVMRYVSIHNMNCYTWYYNGYT